MLRICIMLLGEMLQAAREAVEMMAGRGRTRSPGTTPTRINRFPRNTSKATSALTAHSPSTRCTSSTCRTVLPFIRISRVGRVTLRSCPRNVALIYGPWGNSIYETVESSAE